MAVIAESQKNSPLLAWEASCKRSARYTKLEPIPSRQLLPAFNAWQSKEESRSHYSKEDDATAAKNALEESGERIQYEELRKDLGL